MKHSIRIFHGTDNRAFTRYWWRDVLLYPFGQFWRDLYTAYHRMRYGWSPRDVWNLDGYLDRVLADTLEHLAQTTHGTPAGYPFKKAAPYDDRGDMITDHAQWTHDLLRWSAVFRECADTDDEMMMETGWQHREQPSERRTRVLAEMSYWWESLWD